MSSDPLAQVVALLQPGAAGSKMVTAAGCWAVRPPSDKPFFNAVMKGTCRLNVPGRLPVVLEAGDFVVMPAGGAFTASSLDATASTACVDPVQLGPGKFHLGDSPGVDVRMLVGYCTFGSHDSDLLVSFLPALVVARGRPRLTTLLQLLDDEMRAARPGRDAVMSRLLELLLIEALRTSDETTSNPGLLRGLANVRLAVALHRMHEDLTRPWTMAELAREAAMSRSTFFERFRSEVGVSPMDYLLNWRMVVAKNLLLKHQLSVDAISREVGYSSSSTFSFAFNRHVGVSPSAFVRRAQLNA